MTPVEIDGHTAQVRELLKDASYKRVSTGIEPYAAVPVTLPNPAAPMTFAYAFVWAKDAAATHTMWKQIITGFKAAANAVYPDCALVGSDYHVEDSRAVTLIQAQFCAKIRRSVRGNLVVLDADVVCNKACNPFEAEFDVGLTDCKDRWAMMPFNAGVQFSRDTPEAQLFFDTAMEYACDLPGNFSPWYANQLGMAFAWHVLKDKVNIKVFPYEQYNWAPDIYAPTDAYFVHLKGNRKHMQRDYVLPLLEGRRGRLIVP